MNMKIGTKWPTHNSDAGHFMCALANSNLKEKPGLRGMNNPKYRAQLPMLHLCRKVATPKAAVSPEHKASVPVSHHLSADMLQRRRTHRPHFKKRERGREREGALNPKLCEKPKRKLQA